MDEEEEAVIINAVIQFANLLLDDDDDDVDEFRVVREIGHWVTIDIDIEAYRELPDLTFKTHFRMSVPTFELLVQDFGNHLVEMNRLQRLRTSIDTALLMGLWVLGNPDPFRSIAIKFRTSPGVVHFHYLVLIEALTEMAPVYITWPTAIERQDIKGRIKRRSGFPGVVGFIDSTHIYLTAPREDRLSYVNRHHSHSILAQVVGDDQLLIRDLYVGEPGSEHDSRVFRRSPISPDLLTKPDMMAEDEHILGDGAYILTDKVLIPYRNNGHLTPAQRYFNRMLSAERSNIERLNHLAKCKWRRMRGFESHCIQYAVEHVIASCVLYNFVIINGDEYLMGANVAAGAGRDLDWRLVEDVDPEGNYPDVPAEPDHALFAEARARGTVKRRALTHYFQTGELPAPGVN